MEYRNKVHTPEILEEQEHSDEKTDIADPIYDERLLACVRLLPIAKPVTNQEIRTEAHSLPSYKHESVAGPHYKDEHEEDKKI